jgi:hypothetical protein
MERTGRLVERVSASSGFKPVAEVYERIREQIRMPRPKPARFFGVSRSLVFALGAFLLGIIMTRSIDTIIRNRAQPSRIEVRQEVPRVAPFSDTVEFYSVPAKNLARI